MKKQTTKFLIFASLFFFLLKAFLDILPLEKTGIAHIEWIVYIAIALVILPLVYFFYWKKQEIMEKEDAE